VLSEYANLSTASKLQWLQNEQIISIFQGPRSPRSNLYWYSHAHSGITFRGLFYFCKRYICGCNLILLVRTSTTRLQCSYSYGILTFPFGTFNHLLRNSWHSFCPSLTYVCDISSFFISAELGISQRAFYDNWLQESHL